MDIVTHAMAGLVVAAPLAPSHPVTAVCVALGCVAPDLDVLTRLLGKRAFLQAHQTYSHSLPVIATVTVGGLAIWRLLGVPEPWAPAAMGAAMLGHAAMDHKTAVFEQLDLLRRLSDTTCDGVVLYCSRSWDDPRGFVAWPGDPIWVLSRRMVVNESDARAARGTLPAGWDV